METTERKIPVDPRSTVLGPGSSPHRPSNRPVHNDARPVPYDTGKVKIGCMYQPKQVWVPSADMERLQTALLRKPRPSYLDECKERFLNLLKGLGA